MKKYNLVFLIVFSLLIFPISVFATSGACSSHGGVNCAAGIGNLGANAVCNDGYESSTSYYDTGECIGNLSLCAQPVKGYCTTASDIRAHCGTTSQYTYEMYDICAADCQNQINKYQSDLSNYNSCVSNQSNSSSNITTTPDSQMQVYCVDLFGINVTYNSAKGDCDCLPGYVLDSSRKCSLPICPSNASYLNGKCTCNGGYVSNANGDSCITATQGCQNLYGVNSYADSDSRCYCNNGYQFNDSNQCTIIPIPAPIATPAPATASDNPYDANLVPVKPATTPATVKKPSKVSKGATTGKTIAPSTATPTVGGNIDLSKITTEPATTFTKATPTTITPKKSILGKVWDFIKRLFGK